MTVRTFAVVTIVAALLSLAAANTIPDQAQSVQNLRAFAKLYGYVRFFHPSDEASSIDWDRFAAYGAGRVLGCADAKALRLTFGELFGSIAPSVQVYGAGARARAVKLPGDKTTCEPVAWNHFGVRLSDQPNIYDSRRVGRPSGREQEARWIVQELVLPPADSLVERTMRVRVRARTTCTNRTDAPKLMAFNQPAGGMRSALEQPTSVPITGDSWREYEVKMPVTKGCDAATLGVARGMDGELWADGFEAWVGAGDSWTRLAVEDAGFEDSVSLEVSKCWMYTGKAAKSAAGAFSGHNCLQASADTAGFLDRPHVLPGEYVDKPLDRDLRCLVPLCLWSSDGHTLPRADSLALGRLRAALGGVSFDTLADPAINVRLGDVVIAWNVMQHFYPYFDVARTNWDSVLTGALASALADKSRTDFLLTLRRMGAGLNDGHAWVTDPVTRTWGMVPACVEIVEGRVVVTTAAADAGLRRGDVVLEVNGRPSGELLAEQISQASGSLHHRRARGALRLLAGPKADTLRFLVERGADTVRTSGVVIGMPRIYLQPDQGDSIRELEPGVWYVDLNRAPMAAIDSVMDKLAKAKGVVFDLRGYPNGNHDVISHLLTEKVSTDWMFVPRIVYPDHERILGWDNFGWHMEPKEPRITGKTVFLTNSLAISYAESFMGYIEGYKLAAIVGQPTAGTNGNVNPFDLPGGYRFSWTGMKVVKHDGSQHHLIGIQPTVPVERTLKAVREGRDEYIEAALKVIRQ
jgi:C-terminal processing protease CtpA/Prc